MSENASFVHDCGQEVLVVGWTHGYWRRPTGEERSRGRRGMLCGALPLKGDVCTCGEIIQSNVTKTDEEFTGTLFEGATA